MLDLVLLGGTVIDGTGNPAYRAHVGVQDGSIVLLRGDAVEARRTVDASGLFVTPGFVDPHSHSDFVFFREPRPDMKLRQGVTTEIVGNCGMSAAPLAGDNLRFLDPYVGEGLAVLGEYRTMGEYLDRLEEHALINNEAVLAGHQTIRTAVLGMQDRPPSAGELGEMKGLLAAALDDGAVGLSSGLLYPPMCFAPTEELVALCQVVAQRGGLFTCHMRNYSSEIVDSVQEIFQIAKGSGAKTQISHFMLAGKGNWGKAPEVLDMIDAAWEEGVDITFDQYPYRAANPSVRALLPPWMHEGGVDATLRRLKDPELREKAAREMEEGVPGWESISREAGWENLVVLSEELDTISGKAFTEIAELWSAQPAVAAFDILLQDPHARVIAHWVNEDDLRNLMRHERQMVSSDNSEPGPLAHPRTYGTYPRILGEYVRSQGLLSWEEAIRKMTSFAAKRFGLERRGQVLDGWRADLVVLNPDTVDAPATFEEPDKYPVGIEYVVVNGEIVVEGSSYNGSVCGRILKRTS
jgi:N-acyl-D-amino-acid deacylase